MGMKDRDRERFLARQAEQKAQQEAKRIAQGGRKHRTRVASRQEQYARYLECGPLAWDDRDNPDY